MDQENPQDQRDHGHQEDQKHPGDQVHPITGTTVTKYDNIIQHKPVLQNFWPLSKRNISMQLFLKVKKNQDTRDIFNYTKYYLHSKFAASSVRNLWCHLKTCPPEDTSLVCLQQAIISSIALSLLGPSPLFTATMETAEHASPLPWLPVRGGLNFFCLKRLTSQILTVAPEMPGRPRSPREPGRPRIPGAPRIP